MVQQFVDDEIIAANTIDKQILKDAVFVKMSGILSSSKKQRRLKTLHQGKLTRTKIVDKIIE